MANELGLAAASRRSEQGADVFTTSYGSSFNPDGTNTGLLNSLAKFPSDGSIPDAVYDIPDQPGQEFVYYGFNPNANNTPDATPFLNDTLRQRNVNHAFDYYGELASSDVKLYKDQSISVADPNYNTDPYWSDYFSKLPILDYKGALLYPTRTLDTSLNGGNLPKFNFDGHDQNVWTKGDDGAWSQQNFASPALSVAPEINTATYDTESRQLGERSSSRRRGGGSNAPGTLLQSAMNGGKDLLGN